MKEKISDSERELINVRRDLAKEEHKFGVKSFIAFIGFVVGILALIIKFDSIKSNIHLSFLFLLFFLFLFVLIVWERKIYSNLRKDFKDLIELIKKGKIEDIEVKETRWFDRILFGIQGVLFLLGTIMLTIVALNVKTLKIIPLLIIIVSSLGLGIFLTLSKNFHY